MIGTTSEDYFGDNSAADVQIIPITEANASNTYLNTASSCGACVTIAVTSKEGQDTDAPGDPVCNHGSVSGRKCGTINATHVSFTYDGADLVRMRRATTKAS